VRLVARDPETNMLSAWQGTGFVQIQTPLGSLKSAPSSRAWYEDKREHLAFASIESRW